MSDLSDKRIEAIESRFAAEKQRAEARYDKQIESLQRRKETEIESINRRKENELQRLTNAVKQSEKVRSQTAKLQ